MSHKRSRDDYYKSDEYSSNKRRDEKRDYNYDRYHEKSNNKYSKFNDKYSNNKSNYNLNDKYSRFNDKYSNNKYQNKSHDKYSSNNSNQMDNQIKLETKPKIDPPVDEKPIVKEKINFNLSGKLLEDTNMQNGVIVKYNEPLEGAKPTKKWRLYPFKDDKPLDFIQIHTKSFFLLGRERKVVDIPLDHPSISKQHAVIQFRKVEIERKDGSLLKEIRPYLMDLESSNQTFLNNKPIESAKYYQLLEKDVIKFGFSSREYVVLIDHED